MKKKIEKNISKIKYSNKSNEEIEIIQTIKQWKKVLYKNWNKINEEEKATRTELLIKQILAFGFKRNDIKIKNGNVYKYTRKTKTITQNKKKISIISALHELAHHLFGRKEIIAYKWSSYIYNICFQENKKRLKKSKNKLIICRE